MTNAFKRFTPEERQFLTSNLHLTNAQIGLAIGRSESSIAWQLQQMSLTRGKKRWTDAEICQMRELAKTKTRAEMAEYFGVSKSIMISALKNRKITTGVNSKFQKGWAPINKGKKMPPGWGSEAFRKTQFKKGSIPHNMMKDGDIVTRKLHTTPYKFIRIAPMKWELLHRVNYTKFIGPIPDEMMVTFIDGNTLNCEPDNLKLESKQEHMTRNSIMRFDVELRSVIRLLAKYKRKLNDHEKQD